MTSKTFNINGTNYTLKDNPYILFLHCGQLEQRLIKASILSPDAGLDETHEKLTTMYTEFFNRVLVDYISSIVDEKDIIQLTDACLRFIIEERAERSKNLLPR